MKPRWRTGACLLLCGLLVWLLADAGEVRAAAAAGQDWDAWSETHARERDAILAKYN